MILVLKRRTKIGPCLLMHKTNVVYFIQETIAGLLNLSLWYTDVWNNRFTNIISQITCFRANLTTSRNNSKKLRNDIPTRRLNIFATYIIKSIRLKVCFSTYFVVSMFPNLIFTNKPSWMNRLAVDFLMNVELTLGFCGVLVNLTRFPLISLLWLISTLNLMLVIIWNLGDYLQKTYIILFLTARLDTVGTIFPESPRQFVKNGDGAVKIFDVVANGFVREIEAYVFRVHHDTQVDDTLALKPHLSYHAQHATRFLVVQNILESKRANKIHKKLFLISYKSLQIMKGFCFPSKIQR